MGEAKKDRKTVPLVAELHLIQLNAKTSVEALGRRKFEAYWGVDFKTAMAEYVKAYEARHE